ncbi:MAG TPA: flagellar export chaperone FliS [Acidimicrobiales bacterium]|nr:flagellar export chaperone FliS [Acidimicrobiales bacterium]
MADPGGHLVSRYLAEAVETATPAVRLAMLFDRLELDLRRANDGFESGDLKLINDNLVHAQEILFILRVTLRCDLWDGAERLSALYEFLHNELLHANLAKDRARMATASAMIAELAATWRRAAAVAVEAPEQERAHSQ